MRQRIWRRLFAAAAGAIVLAGSASAQNQTPAPPLAANVVIPVAMPAAQAPVVAQPAYGPTIPSVPAAAAGTPVAPAPGAVVVQGNGGCAGCAANGHGTAARGFVMNQTGGYVGTNCSTGHGCNNGCGSLKSDLGFMFGSCKSFFAPCGPGLHGGGRGGCGHGGDRCPGAQIYGRGPSGPFNPCIYDSYANH